MSDEKNQRTLEDISDHQTHHCVEIIALREHLRVLQISIGVLSTALQRRGVISAAALMAEANGVTTNKDEEIYN